MHPTHTVPDCHLNGQPIAINNWTNMTSDQLAQVVGTQQPGESLEDAKDFAWETAWIPLGELLHATQDGEIPEGGWGAAYARHVESDRQAITNGSPEYAGRDEWIHRVWLPETRIYPLYVVRDWTPYPEQKPRLRLLDGHRRLAGAFFYPFNDRVFALLGTPRMLPPVA